MHNTSFEPSYKRLICTFLHSSPLVSTRHVFLSLSPSHLPAPSLTPTFLPLNYSLYCFVLSAGSPSLTLCLFYSNYHATGYTVTEPINFWSWINRLTAAVYAHKHARTHNLSLQTNLARVYLAPNASACAHACRSECTEYLHLSAPCARVSVCVRGYAGWSCGPVRQGQMVPGGWLSSWWPSWWCCLWSLLIRYASLPESPAPSRCLSFCLSHRT